MTPGQGNQTQLSNNTLLLPGSTKLTNYATQNKGVYCCFGNRFAIVAYLGGKGQLSSSVPSQQVYCNLSKTKKERTCIRSFQPCQKPEKVVNGFVTFQFQAIIFISEKITCMTYSISCRIYRFLLGHHNWVNELNHQSSTNEVLKLMKCDIFNKQFYLCNFS